MATLKQRLHRKNGSAYDVIHMETESNVVLRPSGNTVETDLTNYLPKVQNSDDVPEGLTSGQIVIGVSKGYYCTGDGEVREFGKGGGGVPVLNQDFTYTGECEIIDDSDQDNNWRIKFLTSGIFKILSDTIIDVFLVGGGAAGKGKNWYAYGGSGGFTKTFKNIKINKDTDYNIIIGDGGTAEGGAGGSTSAFDISVSGANTTPGSGGSGGAYMKYSGNVTTDAGSDGSSGYSEGQGTTTREFGESSGDLYAGGGAAAYLSGGTSGIVLAKAGDGGGGSINSTALTALSGTINSGGGGCGREGSTNKSGSGGSGIIIIRNHRE